MLERCSGAPMTGVRAAESPSFEGIAWRSIVGLVEFSGQLLVTHAFGGLRQRTDPRSVVSSDRRRPEELPHPKDQRLEEVEPCAEPSSLS